MNGGGAWELGAHVEQYRLERLLGRGGMGTVHAAVDERSGAPRAIKSTPAGDPDLVLRLLREGQALAALEPHPNLVRVYGSGQAAGRVFLVMERVEGEDLQTRLEREGPLAPADAARVVAVLARALGRCHAHGVLHRDLKPSNVLLARDGTPKLLDFGLAWLAQEEALTRTGELLGTPSHMAPEQALGRRDEVGVATDVHGLGALLFHLLTGRPPYGTGSALEVLGRVTGTATPRPCALRPQVPEALDEICARALARTPAERHPSAPALAHDLERFLRGRGPVSARRLRRRVALFALAVLAALGAAGALLGGGPRELTAPEGSLLVWVPGGGGVEGFWIGRHEVTWAQYERFCAATGRPAPERSVDLVRLLAEQTDWPLDSPERTVVAAWSDQPVFSVTHEDAVAYCQAAGLRLPSLREWMWAARGPDRPRYPWGDAPPDGRQGNFGRGTAPGSDPYGRDATRDGALWWARVGSYPAGASWCGALDVAGNVAEWVADEARTERGYAGHLVCGDHFYMAPDPWKRIAFSTRNPAVGFRVARSAGP